MTTAQEHHDAQLAAIKARHAELAAKFRDPAVTRIAAGEWSGSFEQLGLSEVKVDSLGRFWRMEWGGGAEMVFDPNARADEPVREVQRPLMFNRRDGFFLAPEADATQAAQGFPAKET